MDRHCGGYIRLNGQAEWTGIAVVTSGGMDRAEWTGIAVVTPRSNPFLAKWLWSASREVGGLKPAVL
jgi:hypothetical protein